MERTYQGILKDNHIDWSSQKPPQGRSLNVRVTVTEEETGEQQRGDQMAKALAGLAECNAFSDVEDPSQWQWDIRKDRSLPNREK